MIDTVEYNHEMMRIDADSMICDKRLKFKGFPEECFKFCSYLNRKTGVKRELKHKKRQYVSKSNRSHYHLQQQKSMFNI